MATLTGSLFTLSQLLICTNSSFNISFMSSCVSSVVYRVVSSAKSMNLNTVLECIMSFMYLINRRGPGPKMEPCAPDGNVVFCGLCVIYFNIILFPISQITLHQFQGSFT